MGDPSDSPAKLQEEFEKALEPTEEELTYIFTDDEIRFLCQRLEIKVDMTCFNPLYKYYKHFEKRGSMDKRSPNSKLKLLMKAHKRYHNDPKHMITEEEKLQINKEYWEFRKSQSLRYLKNHRNEIQINNSENSVVEISVPEQENVVINSEPTYVKDFLCIYNQFGVRAPIPLTQTTEEPTQKLDTSLNASSTSEEPLEKLDSSVNALQMEAINNIETESISLDTESIINSIESESEEHVIIITQDSEDYHTFNKRIPLTSTQSQSQ